MICNRCHEEIQKNREIKLKDNSIVCNKCAERIFKEYHKERYKKYLNGEIKYEDLDPAGGRPIDTEFLEVVCGYCFESLAKDKDSEEITGRPLTVAYDKCKGKKCPDCGKVRLLDRVEMNVLKDGFAGFMRICPRCQKKTGYKFNGVCPDCFGEREEERGCVCISKQRNLSKTYYCFLCEDIHALEFWCDRCTKLVKEGAIVSFGKRLVKPGKIIVPSVIGGFALGVIITFLVVRKIFKRSFKKSKR